MWHILQCTSREPELGLNLKLPCGEKGLATTLHLSCYISYITLPPFCSSTCSLTSLKREILLWWHILSWHHELCNWMGKVWTHLAWWKLNIFFLMRWKEAKMRRNGRRGRKWRLQRGCDLNPRHSACTHSHWNTHLVHSVSTMYFVRKVFWMLNFKHTKWNLVHVYHPHEVTQQSLWSNSYSLAAVACHS